MEKERIEWVDIAKGIAIIAMIIGHGCPKRAIVSFIFSFHMPLFFILSGIVYKTNSKGMVSKKIKSLIVPYFIFSIDQFLSIILFFLI